MAYAKTSIGRGCCKVSKKQKKISKLASFCFVLTEILVLAAILILPATDVVEIEKWLQMIIIIILSIHVLMQLWELKVFVKPDSGEKFSLTVQGSHERNKSRHRRTMYGVTVSDEVRVDYDRNCEGILVYFRKVTSSSNTGPYCQPFLLPFRGWFTFFHVLIALTLMICTISIYINYDDYKRLQDYKQELAAKSYSEATQTVPPEKPELDGEDNLYAVYGELLDAFSNDDNPWNNFGEDISDASSLDVDREAFEPLSELGTHCTHPLVLPILLFVSLILQTTAVVSSYYQAEDCGFCIPLFCIGYTRWFKHTTAYTDMIQQNIQAKHGQRLQQEGEQLELAIRRNTQKTQVNDVTYHDVGPQTAKRYEDQIVLLHILLAQEHDQACKEVFPEHSIQNKGVSFILTAEEIEALNIHAEQAMETAAVKTDDTVTAIDTTELVANSTLSTVTV
eukprot:GFUD01107108.1.p1 GENE.GFUD01107108.1~~GFUD01107108.1.p1  ORF type:complete len:450 (-),score=107.92 GFUD01107108.1:132-1481(-)